MKGEVKRVTLVVITAVDGAPFSETCTSAFCTAIAETPSIPAKIAFAALGSMLEPAATQMAKKPAATGTGAEGAEATRLVPSIASRRPIISSAPVLPQKPERTALRPPAPAHHRSRVKQG